VTEPRRPAALIRVAPGSGADGLKRERQVVADAMRERGWPAATVYSDDHGDRGDPDRPALARVEAAVLAGRHDALILAGEAVVTDGGPALLMRLLRACTKNGVAVEFLPSVPAARGATATAKPGAWPALRATAPGQGSTVLTRLRVDALSRLFPGWRIWLDDHGWHARRRDGAFLQEYGPGAPVFCVHCGSEAGLAAQLRDQEAADARAPGRAAG